MQAKKIALLIAFAIMMMPVTANAQTDWVARNIYALNQNIGYGMSIDYNETSNNLKVLLVHNGMATQNIGLAILEVVFGVNSIPSNINAYLIVDDEPLEYQDQLINWSITPVTWTFPNSTEISAYYAYAYVWLFLNQSITNETAQRPFYEDTLTGASYNSDSSVALASYVITSNTDPVYVDYQINNINNWPAVAAIVIGASVVLLVIVLVILRRTDRI